MTTQKMLGNSIIDRRTIAVVCNGTTTINGTNWPVENYVERISPREWRLTTGACNGTSSGSRIFRTKKAALEALSEYGEPTIY